ncbi:MAG: hypothetical protein L6301_08810 [Desulfobacteraceae bacterium]|nr:hypothetical protein [Pseudomonadota bacterium]MCG2751932.1 hypothetical protein [Desulfobacteraceae bacterium]
MSLEKNRYEAERWLKTAQDDLESFQTGLTRFAGLKECLAAPEKPAFVFRIQ